MEWMGTALATPAFLGGGLVDSAMGILGLALGFSWLIFIHELGHFALAKWHGVRVQVFSIGMGPYILSFTRGETVYVLSLIPMGGYVKLAGQDDMRPNLDPSKDPRDYRNKRPGARAAILAAGAVFNLIFALLAWTACYRIGVDMPTTEIDDVAPTEPLAQAEVQTPDGFKKRPLQKGDRITSINGTPVKMHMEIMLAVAGTDVGDHVWVNYERGDKPVREPVRVPTVRSRRIGVASIEAAPLMEVEHFPVGFTVMKGCYVGELTENGPAYMAGLKLDDKLISIEGRPIDGVEDLIKVVNERGSKEVSLLIERDGEQQTLTMKPTLKQEKEKSRYLIGVGPSTRHLVTSVDEKSEAYAQGIREGYFITEFKKLRDGKSLEIGYIKLPEKKVAGTFRIPRDSTSGTTQICSIEMPQINHIQTDSFMEALGMAWEDLIRHSTAVFTVLRGLLTGNVPPSAMSGPLGIAQALGTVSVEYPVMYYFWFLAFISVNLGVLQFVPIPLLDGWHLLMVAVEKVKGSPVAPRVQEAFQYLGIFIILGLLFMATFNDVSRWFSN